MSDINSDLRDIRAETVADLLDQGTAAAGREALQMIQDEIRTSIKMKENGTANMSSFLQKVDAFEADGRGLDLTITEDTLRQISAPASPDVVATRPASNSELDSVAAELSIDGTFLFGLSMAKPRKPEN